MQRRNKLLISSKRELIKICKQNRIDTKGCLAKIDFVSKILQHQKHQENKKKKKQQNKGKKKKKKQNKDKKTTKTNGIEKEKKKKPKSKKTRTPPSPPIKTNVTEEKKKKTTKTNGTEKKKKKITKTNSTEKEKEKGKKAAPKAKKTRTPVSPPIKITIEWSKIITPTNVPSIIPSSQTVTPRISPTNVPTVQSSGLTDAPTSDPTVKPSIAPSEDTDPPLSSSDDSDYYGSEVQYENKTELSSRSSTNRSSTTNTTQINTILRLHSKSILTDFIDEGQFYDVCFEVGTDIPNKYQTFKGFRAFFAVQSTKFHHILFDIDRYQYRQDDDDFKHDPSMNANDTYSVIRITDLHPDTFSFLQKLFYQSFDITIDRNNVIGIMNAAKAYNIPHLWDCCFQYILTIDFHLYSSSFFFLLHEIERYYTKKHCEAIIDRLQPIADTSQFMQFFNGTWLSKLRSNTIIYLLFSARKFKKIPQEYKWKICLFWAQHHGNGNDAKQSNDRVKDCAVSKNVQCYVEYFTFGRMDWTFFIEYVHHLLDDELVKSILCDYIIQHSRIFCEDRGKMTLFRTKFATFLESQKSFVNGVRSNGCQHHTLYDYNNFRYMTNADIIKKLVRLVEFNTRSIEDKRKEPHLYDWMDAFCEDKWKTTSFLYADESMKTYSLTINNPRRHARIRMPPSQSVESLSPSLCDSIQNKLASIMCSSILSDVKFCLRSNQSVYYGLRALFARHSKVFHAMPFTNIVKCDKENTMYFDNVDNHTFEWIQYFLYGHKHAVFTHNNVVQIYRFSDVYLMTDLRTFALKFICCICVDRSDKAKDFLSIIKQLHDHQGRAFWKLFIAQIKEYNVRWFRNECDFIIKHPDFNTLSKGIVKPFLFHTGLFRCYSQEMLWHIIVKWSRAQTPPQNNDLFLQKRLKPFLRFFAAIHELKCTNLDSEEVLVLIMSVSVKQMNQMMQKQRWSVKGRKNIFKHALFVSLPSNIVTHMVANLMRHQNVSEEVAWNACVKWSMAQTSFYALNKTLEPFLNRFQFHTMSIKYFETNVVPRNVLNESQVASVYERFCDYHGLNNTINTKNAIKLCMAADKHSLPKLERNCLNYVAAIDISTQCSDFLIIISTLFQYYNMKNNNVFWKLFIAQIEQYHVRWYTSYCDRVVKHPDFNTLSKDIIGPLLFQTGLFRCYSQEMLWHIVVKWCRAQTPPQNNDLFLQNRLKSFLRSFAAIHELQFKCAKLDSEDVLVLIMSISLNQMNQMMQRQRWSLKKSQNMLKHALFVSLPSNIVAHMLANMMRHQNVSEEISWSACVKWCMAQTSSDALNRKLKPFLKHFKFHTMPIKYFETNVVPRDVLNERQIMSVYERFCDHHGLNNTINTKNVVKLCKAANKHSLRELERNCLKYVARINVAWQCDEFLTIIYALFQYNKITDFLQIMEQHLKANVWTKSQCQSVVNNRTCFRMLPTELVKLLLFNSNNFQRFTKQELWGNCVLWSVASYYDVLGIAQSATADEIKKAYRKQAKRWHPDRNVENTEDTTARCKQINKAYEILSDTYKRARYDRDIKNGNIQVNSNCAIQRNEKLRNFVNYFRFEDMDISFYRKNVEELEVLTDSETTKINQKFVTRLLSTIEQQKATIREKEHAIWTKDNTIQKLHANVATLNRNIQTRDNTIRTLHYQMDQLNSTITRLNRKIVRLRRT